MNLIARVLLISLTVSSASSAHAAIRVAVTLSDIAPIVRSIGGDAVETITIMPSGADPHGFSLSAGDIQRVENAELVVLANAELLVFEERLHAVIPNTPTVTWDDYERHGARLLDFPGNPKNPHGFWLDLTNGEAIARAVAEALINLGADSSAIRSNLSAFVRELSSARDVGLALARDSGLSGDTLVAVIPGVAYIINNLGIHVGEVLLSEGAGYIGGSRLQAVSRNLQSGAANGIVCPVSMRDAKPGTISRQLASDTESKVSYVSFLSTGPGSNSYIAQAYYNAALVVRDLSDNTPSYSTRDGSAVSTVVVIGLIGAAIVLVIVAAMRRQRSGSRGGK
jgi:ABC-type Zn uptake system ZnuABC Zn-binding protein ZnuA